MGLLSSAWRASWRGREVRLARSEVTRGFELEVAGKVAVKRTVTLTGGGHYEGEVVLDDRTVPVTVDLVGSECEITIDGDKLVVETHK